LSAVIALIPVAGSPDLRFFGLKYSHLLWPRIGEGSCPEKDGAFAHQSRFRQLERKLARPEFRRYQFTEIGISEDIKAWP
jgi:hypothetical protein